MTACIVVGAHTPFGTHETEDPESPIARVATPAVADVGLDPMELDEIVGATSLSMHVMESAQVTGSAGDMQLGTPQLAGDFNMGGTAVAICVFMLEPLR